MNISFLHSPFLAEVHISYRFRYDTPYGGIFFHNATLENFFQHTFHTGSYLHTIWWNILPRSQNQLHIAHVEIFHPELASKAKPDAISGIRARHHDPVKDILLGVDWVPPSLPPHRGLARLLICEDNEAVIHCLIKGRNPKFRQVARTHRIDLDFCHAFY